MAQEVHDVVHEVSRVFSRPDERVTWCRLKLRDIGPQPLWADTPMARRCKRCVDTMTFVALQLLREAHHVGRDEAEDEFTHLVAKSGDKLALCGHELYFDAERSVPFHSLANRMVVGGRWSGCVACQEAFAKLVMRRWPKEVK